MNTTFDVCHAHDCLDAPALIILKQNHGLPCVMTVHSTEFGGCGNNFYGGQSARIRTIESEAIYMGDRVIGACCVLCDEVMEPYCFDWDKLRCVYDGVKCLRYDGNF